MAIFYPVSILRWEAYLGIQVLRKRDRQTAREVYVYKERERDRE